MGKHASVLVAHAFHGPVAARLRRVYRHRLVTLHDDRPADCPVIGIPWESWSDLSVEYGEAHRDAETGGGAFSVGVEERGKVYPDAVPILASDSILPDGKPYSDRLMWFFPVIRA